MCVSRSLLPVPKRVLGSRVVVCGLCTMICLAARPQGTVTFQNYPLAAGVNAPVCESDGLTLLSGSQFMAELLAGSSASNLVSLATTGFRSGNLAGYFCGGEQVVPGVIRGFNAWVEVRVWNTVFGATFARAVTSGLPDSWWDSGLFTVVLGGGDVNPTAPGFLTGLGTSPVFLNGSVPEPSTFLLLMVGGLTAWYHFRHRRR